MPAFMVSDMSINSAGRFKFYPLFDDGPGLLAVMPHPSAGDLLRSQMGHLNDVGIDTVVSLLTEAEERELALSEEGAVVGELGMEFVSFPIQDKREPDNVPAFCALVDDLSGRIGQGQKIMVHCWAGIGRSGLLSSAVLVALGISPDTVFDMASRARGASIPETQNQGQWFAQKFLPHFNKTER